MKRIIQDIKEGTFVHVYLLYGEEAYLRKQYRDKLKCALVSPDDTMNCSIYAGKDINVNEVVDMAGTMPFFAERRVIVIENSGWMKTGNEKMVDFLKHIPETTYMIFVEEEVDKRSKLFKAVSSNGYAAVCDVQDENTLKKWIMGLLKKENKLITPDALNLLLDRTGTDMENIRHEVEKLICYKYEEEGITAKDVEELCTVRVQNKIFDMVEAVADKKQKQALDLYYDLLALKEAPLKILALIARQFNILLQVLDDGRLTDGQGRTVDFRNTVVIMTSNLGSDLIQERFGELDYAHMKELVLGVVSHNFRPEFINRIDEVVVFHPLGEQHIASIAQIQLKRLYKRLEERGYEIHISDEALKLLSENGYDPVYGARPLKRAIQQQIENPLAQQILSGELVPGKVIRLEVNEDRIVAVQ